MNSNQRMIETQARLISQLNDAVDELKAKVERLERTKDAGELWFAMQEALKESITLRSQWDSLCFTLALVAPEKSERKAHWRTLLPND